jgi:hypothetical protein
MFELEEMDTVIGGSLRVVHWTIFFFGAHSSGCSRQGISDKWVRKWSDPHVWSSDSGSKAVTSPTYHPLRGCTTTHH